MPETAGRSSFAVAFGDALDRESVSLTALRDQLENEGHSVSLATLSYWRSGAREPERKASLQALVAAEELLGLQPGALTSHLMRRATSNSLEAFSDLLHREPDGDGRHLARGEDHVDRVLFHLVADVAPPPEQLVIRLTQGFVAAREGADGVTLFNGTVEDGSDEAVHETFRAISGCTIGGRRELGGGIEGVWVAFDRPLHLGESVLTEIEIRGDHEAVGDYVGLVAEQQLEEAMVWARFRPDALPSRTWVSFDEAGVAHEWEVDAQGATGVHYRQTAFGPGSLTVRWEW